MKLFPEKQLLRCRLKSFVSDGDVYRSSCSVQRKAAYRGYKCWQQDIFICFFPSLVSGVIKNRSGAVAVTKERVRSVLSSQVDNFSSLYRIYITYIPRIIFSFIRAPSRDFTEKMLLVYTPGAQNPFAQKWPLRPTSRSNNTIKQFPLIARPRFRVQRLGNRFGRAPR